MGPHLLLRRTQAIAHRRWIVTRFTDMSDDWRLQIDVHEHGRVRRLLQHVDATELEHELETAFQDRVVVSNDGSTIFFYAGQREQAERGRQVARRFAEEQGWEGELEF